MNVDERIHDYFTARSDDLDLPAGDLAAVTRRGHRRHQGRTALRVGAIVAVVGVLGLAVAAIAGRGGGDNVQGTAAAIADPELDWTVVTPRDGLGWTQGSGVVASGGAFYALSTAPGAKITTGRGVLYRSDDGTNWSGAALPDQLRASSISADGDRLYAVGTSPSGGGVPQIELASAPAGSEDWSRTAIPLDLEKIGRGFPGKVALAGGTRVLTSGGRTIVAVQVRGIVDKATIEARVPATTAPGSCGWRATDAGIRLDGPEMCPDPASGSPARVIPWADLDVDPAVGSLVDGHTIVLVADHDGPFVQAGELPTGELPPRLFVASGRVWLVGNPSPDVAVAADAPPRSDGSTETMQIKAWSSRDGQAWTQVNLSMPDDILADAGELAGRPALVTMRLGSSVPKLVWLDRAPPEVVDLGQLLGTGSKADYRASAFGPLGLAMAVQADYDSPHGPKYLFHTTDGRSFSKQELPPAAAGRWEGVNGISVTADAVIVRLNSYREGDISGGDQVAPHQRLFVGTPRG